jgi:hypothetical protein
LPTAAPTSLPTDEPTIVPSEIPSTPPTFSDGKLLGVWHSPKEDLDELASYGVNTVIYSPRNPDDIVDYLATAESLGIRVMVNLARHREMIDQSCLSAQQDPSKDTKNCPFDPEAFRSALERYRSVDLEKFSQTSFYAHFMVDEPFDPTNWGGDPVSAEDLRLANAYSKDVLGENIPTAIDAGYLPGDVPGGLADILMSTFYSNKERRFGSLEVYLEDQWSNLAIARNEQADLRYVVSLQAFGGGEYGAFPSTAEMETKAISACKHPSVDGVLWWSWFKPQLIDFSTVLKDSEAEAYIEMIRRVAEACEMGG